MFSMRFEINVNHCKITKSELLAFIKLNQKFIMSLFWETQTDM